MALSIFSTKNKRLACTNKTITHSARIIMAVWQTARGQPEDKAVYRARGVWSC